MEKLNRVRNFIGLWGPLSCMCLIMHVFHHEYCCYKMLICRGARSKAPGTRQQGQKLRGIKIIGKSKNFTIFIRATRAIAPTAPLLLAPMLVCHASKTKETLNSTSNLMYSKEEFRLPFYHFYIQLEENLTLVSCFQ